MGSLDMEVSPELRLLMAIGKSDLGSSVNDSTGLDWKRVANLANSHQVQALLYKRIKNSFAVPRQLLESMQQDSIAQTVANLILSRESERLANELKRNGVEAFLMKGALWASLYYDEIGLRQFGDIDFFVKETSIPASILAMERAGYVADPYRTYLLQNPTRSRLYFATDYQLPLETREDQLIRSVELQWRVSYPRLKFGLDWPELMDAPVECRIGEGRFWVPRPENQLLLMIVHHVGIEELDKLKYGLDLVMLLRKHQATLDWNFILRKAKEVGFLRMLYFGLRIALLLDPTLSLPETIHQKHIGEAQLKEFIRNTFKHWESSRNKPLTKSWRIVTHQLRYRDRWEDRWRILVAHARYATKFNLLYHKARWYFGLKPF